MGTPLPEVLPPSRPPPPSTSSLSLHLSSLLPSLPLPPSPTPVCTTLPTPMQSTTSATPASVATRATLATPTTLESSATPTLDFLLLPPLPPLLRNKLPRLIFPFKFIELLCIKIPLIVRVNPEI